ncbi:MAG: hypothetical protein LQ349_002419 [Xanthoria aureola]|nr:MAG: hypothetical protein LQ349_002419 [Xanthoria aureola]
MNHDSSSNDISRSPPLAGHRSPSLSSRVADAAEDEDIEQKRLDVHYMYKTRFLDHLIRQLDIVIYCQLSILYYLDCSILLFFGRAANHWFYFTPKPVLMSPVVNSNRPNIVAIILLNLASIFVHCANTPPTANQGMRGYSHGGLLIDLVGQKSPVSRIRMIASDILILGLQLVILAVNVDKKNAGMPSRTSGGSDMDGESSLQNHDSEEQGIRRSEEGAEDIELGALAPTFEGRTEGDEDRWGNEPTERRGWTTTDHASNAYVSGQYTVINVYIIDTIQDHWKQAYPESNGASRNNSMARRRPRFTLNLGGSVYSS